MPQPFARTTRSLDADLATRWTRWIVVAAALMAPWAGWALLVPVPELVSAPARVVATGGSFPVQAEVAGRLVTRSAALGAPVAEGEVVFELDAEDAWLELEALEGEVDALDPEITALQARLAAADVAVSASAAERGAALARARAEEAAAVADAALADEEAARGERLGAQGVVTAAELGALRARAIAARARVDAAAGALREVEGRQAADVGTLRADREAVAAALVAKEGAREVGRSRVARLEDAVERRRVRAPSDGVFASVTELNLGAMVSVGTVLAVITPTAPPALRATIPAAEAVGRVQPGQPARLELDAFPWIRFGAVPATVRAVGSEVVGAGVQVEAELGSTDLPLQDGLTGTVRVEVGSATPATLVLRALGAER